MITQTYIDDLSLLISTLPQAIQAAVTTIPQQDLLEVVMDLGRIPEARLPGNAIKLGKTAVSREELDHVITAVGEFGADNRAGIEGTLHRISAIRNRRGVIVGLTLRVGRPITGTIDLIRDLIEDNLSILDQELQAL